ncbi:hypothetical protein EOM82_09010, partial [bacterium]|nr:hypothetical protein [bacterium]
MANIIQNSLIFRWLRTFGLTFYRAWQSSLLGRLNILIKNSYEKSLSNNLWNRFVSVDNRLAFSGYGVFMAKLHKLLTFVGLLLEKSLFYRLILALRDIYLKITKGSGFFVGIHRLSLNQWLLLAFACYLPMDYLFRNKVTVVILSSVWEELFILGAFFLILWRKSLNRSGAIGRETPLDAYILFFMAVGLFLMSIVNPHPNIAFAGYRATVEYMVWFFLVIRLIEKDKDFKLVFYAFLSVGIMIAIHGIYQYIIAVPIPASWVSQTEMGVRTRVFSLTGSPNILGSLMVLTAPLAACMIYYCKKTVAKLFFLTMTGLMCLCLLFTFSRGAWVGMVVAVVIFSLCLDKRVLAIMGGAVASALIFVPSITSRLTYLFTSDYAEASAVGGRTLRWATGRLLMMENNPWTGFGLGRFGGAVAMNNKILEETEEFSYFYMDNYYL